MDLAALTRPELIFPDLAATDREEVLRELADRVAAAGAVRDAADLLGRLREREQLGSTAIGGGVAIPHCKLGTSAAGRGVLAVGIARAGVPFGAADGKPVRLFFLVVSPSDAPADHLQTLAAISRWVKADRHVEQVLELDRPEAIFEVLREAGSVAVAPGRPREI
jgi:PTS system nitrogen regulatory IIA component